MINKQVFFKYFKSWPLGFKNNYLFHRAFHETKRNHSNKLDYLLILDFEATCERNKTIVQEIIEFPCIKLNLKKLAEESRFHHYVRPVVNPILTSFCTDLTGIIQEMIENEKPFPEVLEMFEEWREKENLTEQNSLYVTSGDWDLGAMLPDQCKLCNIPVPSHMTYWINIKKTFANINKHYPHTLIDIIRTLGLEFQGRQHSGIVDCENIMNVVKKLAKMHATFRPTSQLVYTTQGARIGRFS